MSNNTNNNMLRKPVNTAYSLVSSYPSPSSSSLSYAQQSSTLPIILFFSSLFNKRHRLKWWWWWLAASIVLFIIGLLIFITVKLSAPSNSHTPAAPIQHQHHHQKQHHHHQKSHPPEQQQQQQQQQQHHRRRRQALIEVTKSVTIRDLLPPAQRDHLHDYEASGVIVVDGLLYIILDNSRTIVTVPRALESGTASLINVRALDAQPNSRSDNQSDFEAVTYDPVTRHLFVCVEAAADPSRPPDKTHRRYHPVDSIPAAERMVTKRIRGPFFPLVYELPLPLQPSSPLQMYYLPPELRSKRSGAEGLAFARTGTASYLFALLQGNFGHDVRATAHKPGHGRIRVYKRGVNETQFTYVHTLSLPPTASFRSYGDVAINPSATKIAVVSQMDSAVWLGELVFDAGTDEWTIPSRGRAYRFPTQPAPYCNVEGLAFLDDRGVDFVAVSDMASKKRCAQMAQSIHLIRLPS